MNHPLMQNNILNQPKTASFERQSALQNLLAFVLWAALAGVVVFVGLLFPERVILDTMTIGAIAGNVVYLPLIFAGINLCAAVYHFIIFRKLQLAHPDTPLAPLRLWADGANGERSPLTAALIFVAMAILLVAFVLITMPTGATPPVIGINGVEFTFDMTIGELYDKGLVLKDKEGMEIVPEEWSVDKNTAITEQYNLALAGNDAHTAVNISIYNPSNKTVTLADTYIRGFDCTFHAYSTAEVPITVFGVDYHGMTALDAMTAVSSIGGLTLNEEAYRKRPFEAKFTNGPYTYLLRFDDGTHTSLSSMYITLYVQVKS